MINKYISTLKRKNTFTSVVRNSDLEDNIIGMVSINPCKNRLKKVRTFTESSLVFKQIKFYKSVLNVNVFKNYTICHRRKHLATVKMIDLTKTDLVLSGNFTLMTLSVTVTFDGFVRGCYPDLR